MAVEAMGVADTSQGANRQMYKERLSQNPEANTCTEIRVRNSQQA